MRYRKQRLKKAAHRRLAFESLDQRIALSANGLADFDGAAGENHEATVTQDGQQLTIDGGDEADTIVLTLSDGSTDYVLELNGETTTYEANSINSIAIDGQGGSDNIILAGSSLSETAEYQDGVFTYSSSVYDVAVNNVETIVTQGGDGEDRATVRDTAGDDFVQFFDDRLQLTTGDASVNLDGFSRMWAFADNGGNDSVEFIGTTASELFVSKPSFSFLFRAGLLHYAANFEDVVAISQDDTPSGNDRAWVFDSDGDDDVVTSQVMREVDLTPFGGSIQPDTEKDEVLLNLSDGRTVATLDFVETHIIASTGTDTATLTGHEQMVDRFLWSETEARLSTQGAANNRTYVVHGFDQVTATGGEITDRADLRGSDSDDTVIAIPDAVQLTTPNAEVLAMDFGFVVARGEGGRDFAHLEDSEFNDQYLGKRNFAYLRGRDFLNLVTGVEVIDVASFNGGSDRAVSSQYAGSIDVLVWDGPQYWIYGQNRNERVFGMENGQGIGDDVEGDDLNGAGWDTLRALEFAWRFSGAHDQNHKLTDTEKAELAERNETPLGDYELVEGRLVRVGDATGNGDN